MLSNIALDTMQLRPFPGPLHRVRGEPVTFFIAITATPPRGTFDGTLVSSIGL